MTNSTPKESRFVRAPWLHWKPIYLASERQPTHNYSVLALVLDDFGDHYWDVCSFIEGQWMAFGEADEGTWGDVPVKVSHWCEMPWYPGDDGEEPPARRRVELPVTLEEAHERIVYLEAQECLLDEWQGRCKAAEGRANEVERPLAAQMARLNETVTRLNGELMDARSRLSNGVRWIPVGERLPEGVKDEDYIKRSARVVVRVEAPGAYAASLATCVHYTNGWAPGWSVEGWNGDFTVTHWMPLPEPPK